MFNLDDSKCLIFYWNQANVESHLWFEQGKLVVINIIIVIFNIIFIINYIMFIIEQTNFLSDVKIQREEIWRLYYLLTIRIPRFLIGISRCRKIYMF